MASYSYVLLQHLELQIHEMWYTNKTKLHIGWNTNFEIHCPPTQYSQQLILMWTDIWNKSQTQRSLQISRKRQFIKIIRTVFVRKVDMLYQTPVIAIICGVQKYLRFLWCLVIIKKRGGDDVRNIDRETSERHLTRTAECERGDVVQWSHNSIESRAFLKLH